MTKRMPDNCKKIADKGSTEAFLREHVGHESDECLIWPFALANTGYGLAVINGAQKHASRWMCILAHGMPPESGEWHAAHSCGNRACVNPRHLRWATPVENSADRLTHGTDNRGHRNGKTALTEDHVRSIRRSQMPLKRIAEEHGISVGAVTKIRSRQRWGHVT